MKKIVFLILIVFINTTSKAQQLHSSAFYELQAIIHNPSIAGVAENDVVGINYRTQWGNINGSPKTATMFGSFKLPSQKLGISSYVYSDKTGPTSRTGISVSVAKHIKLGSGNTLSLGIENRFQQFLLDQSKLTEYLGADPAIGNANKNVKYNAGFGISYTTKRLQLGVSVAQLLETKLDNYAGTLTRTQDARLYRHLYANGSYKINFDETVSMIPNFLLIYFPNGNAPTELNLGTRFKYEELCWLGLGVNISGNFNTNFGLNLSKKITIDYAFDFYNQPNLNFSYEAHELMLRFNL